ncbi:cupin domain-containing protein [Patescibacteria group bacterium]|nr:cupin domain-containing protein [Patescibacteria group bacterium]MBU1499939.1 cupin domain-containing protein [Patescibacteria group bacterium]
MNVKRGIAELQQKYPGKKIICLPEDSPSEIICEIDPPLDHPEYSVAISVIDETAPHYHQKTTENYEIISGALTLVVDKQKYKMKAGDALTIKPNQIHSAVGNQTWIKCTARPAWTPQDHLLVR